MTGTEVVIVGYARTPIGKFGGGLSTVPPMDLGGRAIGAALERASLPPTEVDYMVMGHVLQAGHGQITARQAAVTAAIPMEVPAETVNKVCLSGMAAVSRARDLLRLREFEVVVAGGMESMSQAPYLLDRARFGYRMGNATLVDSMLHDGLVCAFDHCSMGLATDRYQEERDLVTDRRRQDEWSVRSHERAARAWKDGSYEGEVVEVSVGDGDGVIDRDEGIRPGTTLEALAGLAPAFREEGTITAGNASQISDGAAALVLTTRRVAAERGLEPLATIRAWATVAGPDPSLHLQPANALRAAGAKTARDVDGLDLYEINEAFASVAIATTDALGLDEERVNVNGGAVALGHPIGCTGARITVSLVHELRNRGGGVGAASLCGGGGQGEALIVAVD